MLELRDETIDPGDVSNGDLRWKELCASLHTLARGLIYAFDLPCWRGQEYDLAEDIVQETVLRTLERLRKAERDEAAPILYLQHMMSAIARNYCRDVWRRDRRLLRFVDDDIPPDAALVAGDTTHFTDLAVEHVFREALFSQIAGEIAHFPLKQRQALCVDLANRMGFEKQPTALQAAFEQAGIKLQDYQYPLPQDPRERRQHMSLLSYAYKRLARLFLKNHSYNSMLA